MESEMLLGDIAEIVMGQSPSGETVSENHQGIGLLNGPTEFGIKSPAVKQFTSDPKKICRNGDLLFCVRGSTTGRMNWADNEYAIGRGLAAIRGRNNYSNIFVRASIENCLPSLLSQATGSTFPNVSRELLHSLKLPYVSDKDAHRITFILSSIENKIFNLLDTNKTLESIAQAIFKSWFVDFDPVRAKQQGVECAGIDKATADLFPNSFVESELGLIPKDWGYGTLGEITDFQNGYAFNSKQWTNDGNQVLKIGNVKPGIVEYEGCSFVSNETTVGLERFKLHRGDLLVGMTGYVGETGLVYKNNKSAYLNQRVGKISPKQGTKSRSYIYCCVRNKGYKQYAETLAQGSAQANISGKDLLSYPIVIPNKRCIDLFETNIYPIIDKILNNVETSKDLAAIRDTLLPRLISGKLDLSNIEEQLEGVA